METPVGSPKLSEKSCKLELNQSGENRSFDGRASSIYSVRDSKCHLTTKDKMFQLAWWSRRTRMERHLVILGSIALMLSVGFIIAFILVSIKVSNGASNFHILDLCTNTDCLLSARYIKENIDASINPCENFFNFSCGNWIKKHNIPKDSTGVDVFEQLREEVALQLRSEIEKPKILDEPKAIRDGKDFYDACMNIAVADANGKSRLLKWMQEFGGWPMAMKNWSDSNFSWQQTIVNLTKENSFYFIKLTVLPDAKNTSENIVYVDFAGPVLSEGVYLQPDNISRVMKGYRSLMRDMVHILSIDKIDNVTVNEDVNDTIDFETKLANISNSMVESEDQDTYYNKMTISDLVNATNDKFDWLWYFNEVFDGIKNFTTDDMVIVPDPNLFNLFFDYIDTVDNRTIANFIMWRYVLKYAWHTTNLTRDRTFEFNKITTGVTVQLPRWKLCLDVLDNFFPHVTGSLYVDGYVKNGTKSQATDMVLQLKASLVNVLEMNTWMDQETLDKAREKANEMIEHVAYPDYVSNETLLNEVYEQFVPSVVHIDNVRAILMYMRNLSLEEINEPVRRSDWVTNSNTVNAFYLASRNSISFPAGILIPPFFGANTLKSLNYGGIGAIVGHEMTHAFDATGRQNDKDGNLINWWTKSSLEAYHNKADCIRQQYSTYCNMDVAKKLNLTENVCVNGNQTLDENIADNGGLKIAFNAYTSWMKLNGPEPRLPGLIEYTPEQLFFISYAQAWCGKDDPIGEYNVMKSNEHSPGYYRVMGTLYNSEDFSEVFHCNKDSPMNPPYKCTFW